jgi:hypothetical protein
MFDQIDRMVEELNAEYLIQLKTEHTDTSVYIEFVDHPFVKQKLCTVYVEEDDDQFRFIHNGIDMTSNDITKLKTIIETDVFKQHFTMPAAMTKMIKYHYGNLITEVGTNQSTTKGIIELPVKTQDGMEFNLVVYREAAEVRAESDNDESKDEERMLDIAEHCFMRIADLLH